MDVKMDSTIMLKEAIVNATKNIRKKFNMLKNQNYDMENLLETSFKPITTPLKEFINKVPVIKENNNKAHKKTDETNVIEVDHDEDKLENVGVNKEKPINLFESLKEYLNDLLPTSHSHSEMDLTYGIRRKNNEFKMGNSIVNIANNGDLKINNMNYRGSIGLYELIFKKRPINYTNDDSNAYKQMLIETSAFRKHYDPLGHVNGNRGYKYSNVISEILGTKSGQGLIPTAMKLSSSTKSQYVYWDNANELVERLRLLFSSRSSGHNGHDNEILSIIEELREADLIL